MDSMLFNSQQEHNMKGKEHTSIGVNEDLQIQVNFLNYHCTLCKLYTPMLLFLGAQIPTNCYFTTTNANIQ